MIGADERLVLARRRVALRLLASLLAGLWTGLAVVVLLAACLGKGGGCWIAARLNGEDRRTSLAIGTLMNARGLMELIILNIGLERGLITTQLFSIMVVMAIVTTLMASPLLEWLYWGKPREVEAVATAS